MSRRLVVLPLVLLLAAAVLALNYPLFDHVRDQRVLEQTGVVSSAPVTATEQSGEGDDAELLVTWEVPEGDGETVTSAVTPEAFRTASDQRSIDVRYPADAPSEAYAVASTDDASGLPTWVLWADAGLLALLLLLGATVGRRGVRRAADRYLGSDERQVTSDR